MSVGGRPAGQWENLGPRTHPQWAWPSQPPEALTPDSCVPPADLAFVAAGEALRAEGLAMASGLVISPARSGRAYGSPAGRRSFCPVLVTFASRGRVVNTCRPTGLCPTTDPHAAGGWGRPAPCLPRRGRR